MTHSIPSKTFEEIDIWDASGLQPASVKVFYEYQAASFSDHPYGDTTAREHHPAEISIDKVELLNDTEMLDNDGNTVVKVLVCGTDLMKEPFWTSGFTEYFAGRVFERIVI